MTGPMAGSEGMLTLVLGSLSPAPFTAMMYTLHLMLDVLC